MYRARDSKLDREVAIKLLPELFAHDPDRLARFEREAKTLASLNHPNIASIYGLEESAPSTDSGQGPVRALVMELVEGPTLAERIAQGPIPFDEALPIARQIAEALEAAHDKGVVHRDLKPTNIKITADGRVKVLDFGLAKALEAGAGQAGATAGITHSPTLTMAATHAGVLLGTAAYMSPEQAKGQPVDRRTDIFAFGCVLYEMLAGRPAFAGDLITEILAGVIKGEPDWTRLPADTSVSIRRLLRRCLHKDRNWRPQAAGDLRIEIDEARTEPEAAVRVAPVAAVRRREQMARSAAVLLLAMALGVLYLRQAPDQPAPEMRVEINTPQTTDPFSFAISPDGRRLVFAASGGDGQSRLWLRPLDAVAAQPLAGTEGAAHPFWSPDSRSVAFFAAGKLRRLDIGGGLPQALADVSPGRGGAWSRDGVILFATRVNTPLVRIATAGGDIVPATKLEPRQIGHLFPQFLPDGRHFLFFVTGTTPDVQGIYVGSLDSSETKRVAAADTSGLYVPPGWLLFLRQGTLVARSFDLTKEAVSGDPVTVADPVTFDAAYGVGAFSVSGSGLVMYRGGGSGQRQLTWFDPSGKPVGTIGPPDERGLNAPELSPDGRRVAVHRTEQGNTDVWLLDGIRASRFTFDANIDRFASWSPDGNRIAFSSNRKGTFDLYQKPASGAGNEELLVESPRLKTPSDWSPDGRFLLYGVADDPKTGFDLWLLPMQGDRKPFPFLNQTYEERIGQFSPDGRWVAYVSNQSGRHEIYVRPFPGPGGQWQISTAGGISPRWRADGKELFYIAPDAKLMAVPIAIGGSSLEPGTPVALFQTRIVFGGTETYNREQFDVAPDGRFLINVTTDDVASSPITLLLNWKPRTTN